MAQLLGPRQGARRWLGTWLDGFKICVPMNVAEKLAPMVFECAHSHNNGAEQTEQHAQQPLLALPRPLHRPFATQQQLQQLPFLPPTQQQPVRALPAPQPPQALQLQVLQQQLQGALLLHARQGQLLHTIGTSGKDCTLRSTRATLRAGSARSSASALHSPMMPAPRMHTSAAMSWEVGPAALAAADAAVRRRAAERQRQRRAGAAAGPPLIACERVERLGKHDMASFACDFARGAAASAAADNPNAARSGRGLPRRRPTAAVNQLSGSPDLKLAAFPPLQAANDGSRPHEGLCRAAGASLPV